MIGEFNERVLFQTITESLTAGGSVTESPATLVTVWASVEFLSGTELERAQRISASATVRITTWLRTDVTVASHRAVWNSRTFNIHSKQPVRDKRMRKRVMELFCSEVI